MSGAGARDRLRTWLAVPAVRTAFILALDAAATTAALAAAFFLRFEGAIPPRWAELGWRALPLLVACRLVAVVATRLHRWAFRMSGFSEALRLALAQAGGSALFLAAFALLSPQGLPRSVVALEFFL